VDGHVACMSLCGGCCRGVSFNQYFGDFTNYTNAWLHAHLAEGEGAHPGLAMSVESWRRQRRYIDWALEVSALSAKVRCGGGAVLSGRHRNGWGLATFDSHCSDVLQALRTGCYRHYGQSIVIFHGCLDRRLHCGMLSSFCGLECGIVVQQVAGSASSLVLLRLRWPLSRTARKQQQESSL
jgi:hypothetical protein